MKKKTVMMGSWEIEKDYILHTLLGSCVSICFYCPITKIAAMTHYMLPETQPSNIDGRQSGEQMLEVVYNEMIRRGAYPQSLIIDVAGGGDMFNFDSTTSVMKIGEKNMTFAKKWLKEKNLLEKVRTRCLGGPFSRVITLNPETGEFTCKKQHKNNHVFSSINKSFSAFAVKK